MESGLGFLPLRTELAAEKTTRRVTAQWVIGAQGGSLSGYEIHMGHTQVPEEIDPRFFVSPIEGGDRKPDGAVDREGRTWGTYLHGLFESGSFLQAWLVPIGAERGVRVKVEWQEWQQERDSQLNRLVNMLEEHLDMVTIRSWVGVLNY